MSNVANIGPRQRAIRRVFGLVSAAATLILLAYLLASDLPRAARLSVVIPAWMAGLGLLQAREKT